MIIELESDSFPSVLPLYREMGICFPLILAVIQKKQRGQVFVDKQENPSSAIVITNFGFMSFFGMEQNEVFNFGLAELFASRDAIRPTYLLWYSPPTYWQERLNVLVPSSARRRERVRFEFREDRADFLKEAARCPADFELRNLDTDLIPKTEKFGIRIDSRFWRSAADFLEHGLGVCLVKDNEVVSLCYSACVVDGLAEIDTITQEEHRSRGLGTLVAQQFIRECMRRGITPTWDSFVSNTASMRLAKRLGFIEFRTYSFYSFNIPLRLAEDHAPDQ